MQTEHQCVACQCLNVELIFQAKAPQYVQTVNTEPFAQRVVTCGQHDNLIDLVSPIPMPLNERVNYRSPLLLDRDKTYLFAVLPDLVRVYSPWNNEWMVVECFLCHTEVMAVSVISATSAFPLYPHQTEIYFPFLVNCTDCLVGEEEIQLLAESPHIQKWGLNLFPSERHLCAANEDFAEGMLQKARGVRTCCLSDEEPTDCRHVLTVEPDLNNLEEVRIVLEKIREFIYQSQSPISKEDGHDQNDEEENAESWYTKFVDKYLLLMSDVRRDPDSYSIHKRIKGELPLAGSPGDLGATSSAAVLENVQENTSHVSKFAHGHHTEGDDICIDEGDVFDLDSDGLAESGVAGIRASNHHHQHHHRRSQRDDFLLDEEDDGAETTDVTHTPTGSDSGSELGDGQGGGITMVGTSNRGERGGIACSAPLHIPFPSHMDPDQVQHMRSTKRQDYLPSENQFLWNMTDEERLYAMERASYLSRSSAGPEMSIFGPEGPPMLRKLKQSAESARQQRLQMAQATASQNPEGNRSRHPTLQTVEESELPNFEDS